jgi:drug/metabolite transporter (DMT)-like permease
VDPALLVGLGSALTWGTSAFLAVLAARRLGAWTTNLGVQLTGMLVIVPLAIPAFAGGIPAMTTTELAVLIVVGIVTVGVNAVAYDLLRRAPVAIVYPILASNGAVVTVLAIVVLGETLQPLQVAALVAITGGVVAIAYRRGVDPADEPLPAAELSGGGTFVTPLDRAAAGRASPRIILTAVGITLIAGVVLFAVASLSKTLGWYLPVALDRTAQSVTLGAVLALGYPARRDLVGHPMAAWRILVLAGLLDGAGVALYGVGNNLGSTAVVATTVSTFAMIPVVLGIVLLRERPQRHQLAGIAAVLAGLVLLAAG